LPLGGQNLIEACSVGTPVVVGPHTFNFAQATQDAIAAGACVRVTDAKRLMTTAAALLDGSPGAATRLADMGAHARAFAELHRGATARTVQALAAAIPLPGNAGAAPARSFPASSA